MDMGTEEGRREVMGSFALEGMQPSAQTVSRAREDIAGRLTTALDDGRNARGGGVAVLAALQLGDVCSGGEAEEHHE